MRCAGSAGPAASASSPIATCKAATNRFANALRSLGVREGDSVFVLAGRIPELYIAVLGALKAKCVVSPLFSAFGPEPIATRLTIGEGRVLVTTEALYRRKVAAIRAQLPKLEHVILVPEDGERRRPAPARSTGVRLVETQSRGFRHPADRPRGSRPAAFHQRHDRPAQGRDPCARGGGDPPHHRPSTRSTCTMTTSSGAPPIPAGSPARATASSRR